MKARFITFGEIEIDGQRYAHDVVIDGGQIRKRAKNGRQPIIGAGVRGRLPPMLGRAR